MQSQRPELLTVNEVADTLRLGRTATNQLMWTGVLPSVKLGRRRLVRREDLERFLDERKDRPEA